MVDIAKLQLSVDSRQVKEANKDLKGLEQQGGRTEKATDQLGAAFRRVVGPLAAYLSTRQIIQAADAWTTINNRLRLVTDSTEELLAAQNDVFEIAQRSRQPLEATAELYQRIATNADELNLSGEGVAAVVDTINKTLAISGTSGASASAALTQLGQAFASGTLRGEELNSVLEQAPALAKSIAAGMGVTVGQLRALGQEGVLSAQNVIDALLNQGQAVDDQFSTIESTVSQSFVTLSNSLTRTVGELDKATGATGGLADAIISISQFIDSGALVNGILETMALWRGTIGATQDGVGDLSDELDLLKDTGGGAVDFLINAFKELPVNVRAFMQILTVEVASAFDLSLARAKFFKESVVAVFTDDTIGQAFDRLRDRLDLLNEAREDSIQTIFNERQAILSLAEAERSTREKASNDIAAQRKAREDAINALRASATGVTLGSGGSKESDKEAEKTLDMFERTESSLKKQIALYGQTTDAARLRYEVESGSLTDLNQLQKDRIVQLGVELDTLNAHAEFAEQIQSIIDESMPDADRQIKELNTDLLLLNVALDEGKISWENYKAATDSVNAKIEQIRHESDEFAKQLESLGAGINDTLLDGISNAIGGVEDWEKTFLAAIAKILIQLAALKMEQSGYGGVLGKSGFNIGSAIVGAFGIGGGGINADLNNMVNNSGLFASGGRPPVGKSVVVGDGGMPEAFIADGPGTIVPMDKMGGTKIGNVNFNFPGVTNKAEAEMAAGAAARKFNRLISTAGRYN